MGLVKWIVVLALSSSYVSKAEDVDMSSKYVNSTNCFSVTLFPKLKPKDGTNNLIYSGLCADVVLSMLQMGAQGSTYKELDRVLQYQSNGLSKDDIKNQMQTQLGSLSGIKEVTLNIANSMWIEKQADVYSSYKAVVEQDFQSTVSNLDFLNNPHAATDTINQWVNDKTNSLIPKLFTDGSIDSSTALVLVNAIYFKGTWAYPFEVSRTKTAPFRNNDNQDETKMVSLMNQIQRFKYKRDESLQAQILEIPYKDGVVSFIAILPEDGVNLKDVESKLDCTQVGDLLKITTYKKVNVTLPKMDLASDLDLKMPLEGLNVSMIFNSPDLSLISNQNLAVTKVVQKAMIKVYEQGSEAAAATGAVANFKSARIPTEEIVQFNANHPFLYYIVHKSSGQILFAGRMSQF